MSTKLEGCFMIDKLQVENAVQTNVEVERSKRKGAIADAPVTEEVYMKEGD